MNSQDALFPSDATTAQKFDAWRQSPGGKRVLQITYAITAPYARRFVQSGRQVSIKLIWEIVRYNLTHIRVQLAKRGEAFEKLEGFALNNIFTAHVARHLMNHRAEWNGLFELRELNKPRVHRKVLVIEERKAA